MRTTMKTMRCRHGNRSAVGNNGGILPLMAGGQIAQRHYAPSTTTTTTTTTTTLRRSVMTVRAQRSSESGIPSSSASVTASAFTVQPACAKNGLFSWQRRRRRGRAASALTMSWKIAPNGRGAIKGGGSGRFEYSRNVSCNADMGGEYYGDSFGDVDKHLVDYFTYKALRVVLEQLQEMDTSPGKREYTWLYKFAVEHSVRDSRLFIKVRLRFHIHTSHSSLGRKHRTSRAGNAATHTRTNHTREREKCVRRASDSFCVVDANQCERYAVLVYITPIPICMSLSLSLCVCVCVCVLTYIKTHRRFSRNVRTLVSESS